MRRRRLLSAAVLTLAGAAALRPGSGLRAEIIDRVVAVIEDEAVFQSDVNRRMRPFEQEFAAIPSEQERATVRERRFCETVERMVDDSLIRRAATRAHITVNEEDVDRLVRSVAEQRGASPQDLYEAVEAAGVTRSEYRSFMEAEVLRLRVFNQRVRGRVNISPADVAEEYRRRARALQDRAPVQAAHVFFAFPENPTAEQVAEVRRRAELAARRARTENFDQLVLELSEDTETRQQGGSLGMIDPGASGQDAMPAWVLNALRDLQPGGTSGAVRGDNGFHVFRLTSRQTVTPPELSSVREQIGAELLDREVARAAEDYLRELRQRTAVEVRVRCERRSIAAQQAEQAAAQRQQGGL